MIIKKTTNKKGFSIIEVIVSVGIIALALLGVSSLNIQSLQAQRYSRDYFLASILAQEGAELVRNFRDTNWILEEEDDWALYIYDPADEDFVIDYGNYPDYTIDATVQDFPPEARLYIDANGYYSHDNSGTPVQYYRYIKTNMVNDGLQVDVIVRWSDRGRTNEYLIETYLYNWR